MPLTGADGLKKKKKKTELSQQKGGLGGLGVVLEAGSAEL